MARKGPETDVRLRGDIGEYMKALYKGSVSLRYLKHGELDH